VSAELLERSASELTRDLATRQTRATELMAAYLARIDEVNPALNAICTVDGEVALAAAAVIAGASRLDDRMVAFRAAVPE
jgi:amidase